jgi:RNA polymerase sigma-54 factor
MGQKQYLGQKQMMKQTASMQTVQFMRLLAMPANKLEDEIRKVLDENPALETEKEPLIEQDDDDTFKNGDEEENEDTKELSMDNPFQDDYLEFVDEGQYEDDYNYAEEKRLDYEYENLNRSGDEQVKEHFIVQDSSLQENLLFQLGMQNLTEKECFIAKYLIGNLDDQGFLVTDSKTYANELLLTYNIVADSQEIEKIIKNSIQELEPSGIGARDLQECFLIQLRRKEKTPAILLAEKIIKKYFEEFSKKHFDKIISHFGITEKQLKEALHEIQKLDPSPGFSSSAIQNASTCINPDFIVEIEGENILLSINNQHIPKLKINTDFTSQYHFLNSERNLKVRAEAERFLKENLDNAQNLIDSLSQREMIMYNVMYAIIQRQKEYFLSGSDIYLKPMVLKDISQKLGIDISTVSRASNNKYVQTPYGMIPLKHLFSESIGKEDVSSRKIKELISQFIVKENNTNPYTDEQICQYLSEQGHTISRRTIAKYREQLHIPVARLRKRM